MPRASRAAGLGLNITQELVNLLQGRLRLESVKDKGSTFTVTIPLALGTAPAAEEAEEQKPLAPAKPHFENHKILLLDPLQLRLLQEMLKKLVGDSWQVFACPGETRQLFWKSIRTELGEYSEYLKLIDSKGITVSKALIELKVTKLELPKHPAMDLCVWDCSLRQLKDKDAENLARILGESGVNVFHVINKIKVDFNKHGEIIGNVDFSELDGTLDIIRPYADFALLRCCRFSISRIK